MSRSSEVRTLIYNTLNESTFRGYLGGSVATPRISYEWPSVEPKLGASTPGYVVIEYLANDAPTGQKREVMQRVIVHLYCRASDTTLMDNVESRLTYLFDIGSGGYGEWKAFSTSNYKVFTKSGGRGAPAEDRTTLIVPYYLDVKSLPA